MPVSLPFAASERELSDKPRRIPKSVQLACLDMIHRGIDFIEAARANGIKPDTLRRHLHRIEAVGFVRRERAAFREALCAANEFYLAEIRANSANACLDLGNWPGFIWVEKNLGLKSSDAWAKCRCGPDRDRRAVGATGTAEAGASVAVASVTGRPFVERL